MDGMGRPGVLAVAASDPVMSLLGPIGLAASVGTALIVDMGLGLHLPRSRTLADIAADGPRLEELAPGRSGVAFVSSGGLAPESVVGLVHRLARHWPAIVVRVGPSGWDGPTAPLFPLYPGWLAPDHGGAAVWQRVPGGCNPPGPGPVLPSLRRAAVGRMLAGGLPRLDRWVRTWREVWALPWA